MISSQVVIFVCLFTCCDLSGNEICVVCLPVMISSQVVRFLCLFTCYDLLSCNEICVVCLPVMICSQVIRIVFFSDNDLCCII